MPLYQAVYQDFPAEPLAGLAHWKVTFQAYLHDKADAAASAARAPAQLSGARHRRRGAVLPGAARRSSTATAASARACYQRLSDVFQNHYYAMLARERLRGPRSRAPRHPPTRAKFLAGAAPGRGATPVPSEGTRATTLRIERSRLLRTAGLSDLADSELRFGARTDGQPALLGMEMADAADAPHRAMHIMKGMAPDYLNLPLDQAPRKFWELLFPLPYRSELVADAREHDLDPFLVAGLIRQESEFNPEALSPANAYGLTQVRPVTGRAVRAQGRSPAVHQPRAVPAGGQPEDRHFDPALHARSTTAARWSRRWPSYNAGPNRVAEWLTWNTYREPAEFVESIPFTETRDYVQAVLRNADIYRRLYR